MGSHRRPSVLQISHDYLGPFVSVCRQYNRALADCEITTLYLRGKPLPYVIEETAGGQVIFLEKKKGSLRGIKIAALIQLYRILKQQKIDFIIAHRYKPLYLAGIMSYFFSDLLVIGVIHEHGVLRRLHRKLFLGFWRRNIKIIAVSDSVAKDLANDCQSLKQADRLSVLHNAMDIEHYKSKILSKTQARKELGLPASGIIIGTLGRLVRKKNQQFLIKAMSGLDKNIILVIVGEGPLKDELASLSKKEGVSNRVIFSGYKEAAYQYLGAFDLFILTSGSEEAFGYVLLEAMIARVPMLISDSKGPLEVTGDSALVYKQEDLQSLQEKIEFFAKLDPGQVQQMADAGFSRLNRHFSLQTFSSELLSIPYIERKLEQQIQ